METVILQVTQTATLKASLKACAALCKEGKITLNPEGIHFFGVSPGGAAAMEWKLGAEAFENYPSLPEPFEIHIKPEEWVAAFKRSKKEDVATITLGDNETTLELNDGVAKRKVSFPLWDFTFQWAKIPDHLEYTAQVEMPPARFLDAVNDANENGSSVELRVEGDLFKVSGLDDLKEKFHTAFAKVDDEANALAWSGEAFARFDGNLLLEMLAFSSEASKVYLAWKTHHPLKVGFTLPNFTLTGIVAPRVENN